MLFLVTAVFLLVGIGATIAVDAGSKERGSHALEFKSPENELSIYATGTESVVIDREERLMAMREKLESMTFSEISSSPPEEGGGEDLVEEANLTMNNDDEFEQELPWLCENYSEADIVWSPLGLEFEEIEGARLVYRQLPPSLTPNASGTDFVEIPNREVVLQLSLRTMPLTNPTCLTNDVIGIATDGSLIRNSEAGLYSIFDSETLVGYALDGFPIYGNDVNADTDQCGGTLAGDTYRYVVSNQRDYILGCFSGSPTSLN